MFEVTSYEEKKRKLLSEFHTLIDHNKVVTLKKTTSNLFRKRKSSKNRLDVHSFNKVLNIDKKNLVAEVEGMTTYEDLVSECLKQQCLPAVVPELKSITVGGALSGLGVESSSFIYGLVHETLPEYEVLDGNGDIILCKPHNEHSDLYYGFPNSYATFAYALKIKVNLVPALPFVKITHHRFSNPKVYFSELQRLCQQASRINFIDGVVFYPNEMYITTGEFVEEAPYVSNYKYLNIYYRSLQKRSVDYLTTLDYIWRWDSDWFWCSKHYSMDNYILRLLLGKFLLKSNIYWKIKELVFNSRLGNTITSLFPQNTESVVQDVQIPIHNAPEFLDFFQKEIKISPVWICPLIQKEKEPKYPLSPFDSKTLYINFGFWDTVKKDKDPYHFNKLIENELPKLNGHKALYSTVHYTEDEFWHIYDRSQYTCLKDKYDPHRHLPDLYNKVTEK